MTAIATPAHAAPRADTRSHWLKRYYGLRALFSAVWVVLACSVGRTNPAYGAGLLILYPLWDGVANVVDAKRNGGLATNPTQLLNAGVSALVTLAVAATVGSNFPLAIGVIGVWAALAGILQLSTGLRRWRETSAQWPQILSGAQSCLAAAQMIGQAAHPSAAIGVTTIAPYAAFGALYFAISAGVLAWKAA